MPSTSTKQLDKGKEKVIDEEEEDKHETEQEFQLIHLDSDDENEERITRMLIKRKDAQIRYLQANLGRVRNVINFLEVENKQLEIEKAIYEIKAIRAQKEARKAKEKLYEVLETHEDIEEEEEQLPRRRPRTIGLRKALAKKESKRRHWQSISLQVSCLPWK